MPSNTTITFDKTYNPVAIEHKWYEKWESSGHFEPTGNGSPYCIMIPPPNVTGSLHMGHGFLYTLMDVLVRYHRMKGYNTLWQVGTDHAGIATQMVVERQLNKNNESRLELGREKFVERIWEWKHKSGNRITKQLRRIGASVDWTREKFTLDDELSEAVREVFIKLYKEKLIYRGKRLVNWDPKLQTAISDLEVNNKETKGSLWHIKYPIKDSNESITVATTRPETMFGDVAVAVHPEDERYMNLVGKTVILPLADKEIPIIADTHVDKDFGTGCLKITPAHDVDDYNIGKRHNLPIINILTKTANLNENVPSKYRGLDRQKGRAAVLKDLKEQNLLEKVVDHKLVIPYGDRSGEIIEPYLTDQWFVDTKPLVKPAIAAVESGEISFIPENWTNTYYHWLNNIEDWCISRQLWWGHRIPAWYDNDGNCYVGNDENDVRVQYKLPPELELQQDKDVLDTWFSSALWPFSTLGWPKDTDDFAKFFPTEVLITGFDIIFFWVARMIMFSLKFTGKIPFKKVFITGLIRDINGQKMSKSKGNIIDPIDIIDGISLEDLLEKRTTNLMQPELEDSIRQHTIKEYPNGILPNGCDALRFNFCALASMGRDIRFDIDRLVGYRNFCNKLWNATRFVLMQCNEEQYLKPPEKKHLQPSDIWIQSLLQSVIKKIDDHFLHYRFDLLSQVLHDFVWNEFCAWYVELSKITLFDDNISYEIKYATSYTLLTTLEKITRILHPIIPFITEEIWQSISTKLGIAESSLMIQKYPTFNKDLIDKQSEKDINWLKEFISLIRNIRGEMNINPNKKVTVILKNIDGTSKANLSKFEEQIKIIGKITSINELKKSDKMPESATALLNQMEIHVPIADLINKEAELERIKKTVINLEKEQLKLSNKLTKTKFATKAPKEIVDKEKERLEDLTNQINQLNNQFTKLQT